MKECPKADGAVQCKGNTSLMDAKGCSDCVCTLFEEDGVSLPFRYDSVALGLYGNGLCIPSISTEKAGDVYDIVADMLETFKTSDAGQYV